MVAWGGIEKSVARRAITNSHQFVLSAGYTSGYTKTGLRRPGFMASHHGHLVAESHYPPFAGARQPAPLTANKVRILTKEARYTSWQTGSVARSQPTPMDAIASAIRLLTDNGYLVLKAPTWPEHLPVEAVRAGPISVKTPTLASGSHAQDVLSDVREFMSVKQFCSLFSICRSTVYTHMKSGRLKVQKIDRSTRISRQSVHE